MSSYYKNIVSAYKLPNNGTPLEQPFNYQQASITPLASYKQTQMLNNFKNIPITDSYQTIKPRISMGDVIRSKLSPEDLDKKLTDQYGIQYLNQVSADIAPTTKKQALGLLDTLMNVAKSSQMKSKVLKKIQKQVKAMKYKVKSQDQPFKNGQITTWWKELVQDTDINEIRNLNDVMDYQVSNYSAIKANKKLWDVHALKEMDPKKFQFDPLKKLNGPKQVNVLNSANSEPYWSGFGNGQEGEGFLSAANKFYDKNIEGTMLDTGINVFTDPLKHGYNAVGALQKILKSQQKITEASTKLGNLQIAEGFSDIGTGLKQGAFGSSQLSGNLVSFGSSLAPLVLGLGGLYLAKKGIQNTDTFKKYQQSKKKKQQWALTKALAQSTGQGLKNGVSWAGQGIKSGASFAGQGIKSGASFAGQGIKTAGNWAVNQGYNYVGRGAQGLWNNIRGKNISQNNIPQNSQQYDPFVSTPYNQVAIYNPPNQQNSNRTGIQINPQQQNRFHVLDKEGYIRTYPSKNRIIRKAKKYRKKDNRDNGMFLAIQNGNVNPNEKQLLLVGRHKERMQ